jgi:hypothetical protein
VLCAVVSRAPAEQQNTESSRAEHGAIRESSEAMARLLVSSDQGLQIIAAALESRKPTNSNADCSNLVHAIYERAGFTYAYSNSSELYRGIKEFRRVVHPQPGDLVVWRGHVGIVISPVQHSFFSAMRSGRGVEFYDSPYWQTRGQPRFFRYLKAASRTQLSASNRNANLNVKSLSDADSNDSVPAGQGTLGGPDPLAASPETKESQAASLHKSESQPAGDAQSTIDQSKRTPAGHKIQGPEDGAWVKTATKPSPEIPFDSAVTPTPPYKPRPQQVVRAPNTTAKASRADATPPPATGSRATESKTEPVQWEISRYVPRPPWASTNGRLSSPATPRSPAGHISR